MKRKLNKKEEEERKKKEQEEAEEAKRKEEEEKKKSEAEATAASKNKKKGGKEQQQQQEEEPPRELTEEEKKEKERQQINKSLEEVRGTIQKLDDKLSLIDKTMDQLSEEAKADKVLDLEDKNGERKFAKTKADLYANTFLTEKMSYVFGKVVKTDNDEEEFQKIKIDGA